MQIDILEITKYFIFICIQRKDYIIIISMKSLL